MNIAAQTKAPAIPWAEADRNQAELVGKTDIKVEVITGRIVAASVGASVDDREIRGAPLIEDEFPVKPLSVPFSIPVMISLLKKNTGLKHEGEPRHSHRTCYLSMTQ